MTALGYPPANFLFEMREVGYRYENFGPRFNIEISLRDPDFIIMIFVSSAGVLDIL